MMKQEFIQRYILAKAAASGLDRVVVCFIESWVEEAYKAWEAVENASQRG